jgi:hypothetical protein
VQQYHRLIRRQGEALPLEAERQQLLDMLSSASGVLSAEILDAHPKGGYWIRVDLEPEAMDDFLAYLDRSAWMSVF